MLGVMSNISFWPSSGRGFSFRSLPVPLRMVETDFCITLALLLSTLNAVKYPHKSFNPNFVIYTFRLPLSYFYPFHPSFSLIVRRKLQLRRHLSANSPKLSSTFPHFFRAMPDKGGREGGCHYSELFPLSALLPSLSLLPLGERGAQQKASTDVS